MEVWGYKQCKICNGYKVRADKSKYDEWDEKVEKAEKESALRIKLGDSSAIVAVDVLIAKLTKGYPPCSFCNGEGGYGVREPDEKP